MLADAAVMMSSEVVFKRALISERIWILAMFEPLTIMMEAEK